MFFVFFFQAEDGIRYLTVTGVQTCALPICNLDLFLANGHPDDFIEMRNPRVKYREPMLLFRNNGRGFENVSAQSGPVFNKYRSEERRVGKECRSRRSPDHKKKKKKKNETSQ